MKVQAVLAKCVTPGMTAYNLGAHIGFFTLGLMNLVKPGGQVLAFEPNPRVRDKLIDNVSLNSIGHRVRVENWALSDFDGQAEFSLGHSSTQGRFQNLPFANLKEIITVGCKRLDTYVEEGGPAPDFILMDVEHAEGRVLRGMRKILESRRPILLLEMHGPESIREAWKELEMHNYQLARVPGLNVVTSLRGVGYGHCLATPLNFRNRNQDNPIRGRSGSFVEERSPKPALATCVSGSGTGLRAERLLALKKNSSSPGLSDRSAPSASPVA